MSRPTVLTDISALLIGIHEFSEGLDNVDVLLCPCDHQLGALVEAIVENLECLQNVPPVLALVVQPLI
jgi:hypothetical protein